ncbi:ABC transporter permease [Aureivirga marina]|uniref:ABC transporter permease n=1 Tax=Aureivirga marina TaxID=1182451 RepID=UPI0018C94CED|nr:ABC transporter permease [Aureivirga marina]
MKWKVFWAFVKKEFYHITRDKRTLLILFGMPIAQVLIFGFVISTDFKNASIDFLNHANDETSFELIEQIQSSENFKIGRILYADHELEKGFKDGTSKLVMVIPEDFSKDFYNRNPIEIQILTDGSDPNNAVTLTQYITSIVGSFQQQKLKIPENPQQINIETKLLYNPKSISAYNFIPGTIALILMIISAMLTSLTIAREKETGTIEILLVSPLSPLLIILGKVAPYALLSFIDAILILVLGFFVFEVPVRGSLILLLFCCLIYVITSLTIGTLISAVSKTQQDAMMRSLMGLMMPSMILSGFIFPLTSMPFILQVLGHIIPTTYFIEILKGIMLRGVGLEIVWFPLFVLFLMILFFLFFTWKNFKTRLQ